MILTTYAKLTLKIVEECSHCDAALLHCMHTEFIVDCLLALEYLGLESFEGHWAFIS